MIANKAASRMITVPMMVAILFSIVVSPVCCSLLCLYIISSSYLEINRKIHEFYNIFTSSSLKNKPELLVYVGFIVDLSPHPGGFKQNQLTHFQVSFPMYPDCPISNKKFPQTGPKLIFMCFICCKWTKTYKTLISYIIIE